MPSSRCLRLNPQNFIYKFIIIKHVPLLTSDSCLDIEHAGTNILNKISQDREFIWIKTAFYKLFYILIIFDKNDMITDEIWCFKLVII